MTVLITSFGWCSRLPPSHSLRALGTSLAWPNHALLLHAPRSCRPTPRAHPTPKSSLIVLAHHVSFSLLPTAALPLSLALDSSNISKRFSFKTQNPPSQAQREGELECLLHLHSWLHWLPPIFPLYFYFYFILSFLLLQFWFWFWFFFVCLFPPTPNYWVWSLLISLEYSPMCLLWTIIH